jgi:hypothetical protein
MAAASNEPPEPPDPPEPLASTGTPPPGMTGAMKQPASGGQLPSSGACWRGFEAQPAETTKACASIARAVAFPIGRMLAAPRRMGIVAGAMGTHLAIWSGMGRRLCAARGTAAVALFCSAASAEPAVAKVAENEGFDETSPAWFPALDDAPPKAAPVAAPPPVAPPPQPAEPMSYRGPLALWYGVALASTWIPYPWHRNCIDDECSWYAFPFLFRPGTMWGPSIVHWTRGQTARGFVSLGGQITALVVGAIAGDSLLPAPPPCEHPAAGDELNKGCHSPARQAFDGWLIADVIWAATDVLLTPATIAADAPAPRSTTLSPSFGWSRDGARVTLSGTF